MAAVAADSMVVTLATATAAVTGKAAEKPQQMKDAAARALAEAEGTRSSCSAWVESPPPGPMSAGGPISAPQATAGSRQR